MKLNLKSALKFAVGTCAVLGVAAVATSGTAAKVVGAGLKAGADAMKEQWEALRTASAEKAAEASSPPSQEAEMFADVSAEP